MTLKQRKCMVAASVFAGCVLAVSATAQVRPAQPVVVTNSASQSVPTVAQGTTNVAGTVNIGNTPSVTVTNTPSVNVSNTPTVNLASGAGVTVTNPLDGQNNPVPLAALDATQPYEDSCTIPLSGTHGGDCNFQAIPAGKRLVIQEFDAFGFIDTGVKPVTIIFLSVMNHAFPATFMGGSPGYDYFATHQETRLYVAPGGYGLFCAVSLSGQTTGQYSEYSCALSGYLVDVP